MGVFWGDGSPFLELFSRLDLTTVAELACGHGRHAEHIVSQAAELFVIDIHESNIVFCRERLAAYDNVRFVVNNGYDLRPLEDRSISALFCYDAMVHFAPDVIRSYLNDTSRVLCRGGLALYHHSNYDAPDSRHYGLNPHARNRMTQTEFVLMAEAAGLEVVESRVLSWGDVPDLDCVTLLRRPTAG